MKKGLMLFGIGVLIAGFGFAQNPLVKQWDYRFGGTDTDWLYSFQQTADGGYILGGLSVSDISGDKTEALRGRQDYWIVKTDSFGIKQWDKDFGGASDDGFSFLRQTADGGYILGGQSLSDISGDKTEATCNNSSDYWIVKTDALGNKQWDKDLGGTDDDVLISLQQVTDGGYILGGFSYSGIGCDKTQTYWGQHDYWIVKTDSQGNKLWDKTFGGTSGDYFHFLQETTDGGFILGGGSDSDSSGDKTQPSWGNVDYWIVKIDSVGNKLWDKDFGGTSSDVLSSIKQTSDGGYILGGLSHSGVGGNKTQPSWGNSDYWIIKTDSLGNMIWDKDFGGTNAEYFSSLQLTVDGGYLISGTSNSNISGDKTENNLGTNQTWVIKIDSLGRKQWDKTIFTSGQDDLGFAIQASDGCYIIASRDNSGIGGYKTQMNWNSSSDYWIVKLCDTTQCYTAMPTLAQSGDTLIASQGYASYQWYFGIDTILGATNYFYVVPQNGNYNIVVTDSNGCIAHAWINNVLTSISQPSNIEHQISIYPNPAKDNITVYFPATATATLSIYNSQGEKVYSRNYEQRTTNYPPKDGFDKANELKIPLKDFSDGIYFLCVQSHSGISNRKFVVSK